MVQVARLMLAGQYDLIEGCRRIVSLGSLIDAEDEEVLIPFRGFDSETDHFPRGDVRRQYAPVFLESLDKESDEYLADARTEILRFCSDLLTRFDG